MAQTLKLRTHTEMDFPRVAELQRVVDRVLVPNCIRKTQVFYLGMGVLCLAVGAGSVWLGRQRLVGAIFGLLGLALIVWGLLAYYAAARKTYRQIEKAARSADYILGRESVWLSNGKGDFHYPYKSCVYLVETEKNIYFVTDQGETLILDKSSLKGGTPEDLRAWLTEKCGKPVVTVGPNGKIQAREEKSE